MIDPPVLTADLLEGYLERVVRWGVPGSAESLAPGLSDEEIDRLTEPTGLTLPDEARTLWRWRNGAPERKWFYGSKRFPSLQDALSERTFQRELAAEPEVSANEEEMETHWPSSFLPIFLSEDPLAIDCRDPNRGRTPVHLMPTFDYRDPWIAEPQTESIGQLITWWTAALDRGLSRHDPETGNWNVDPELIIREQRHVT